MKGEDDRTPRQELRERPSLSFLRRELEGGRDSQRGRSRHQNSFTSTSSPASTISVCAGISMNPSASDMLVMSPDALNAGTAMPAFKASGDITSMSRADGYIEIPAQTDIVEAGEIVDVKLF